MSAALLVLVVDDDREMRNVVQAALVLAGYQVAVAADGAQAMEQLQRGLRPALILLDLIMPNVDGRAFLAWQRQDPAYADIPVVLLTGHEGEDLDELGCQGRLSKMLDLSDLFATVRRCARPPG